LAVLPGIGIVFGLTWFLLGIDCDNASELFRKITEKYEEAFLAEAWRTQQLRRRQENKRDESWRRFGHTGKMITYVPFSFVALDIVLLVKAGGAPLGR
jgi:hypothetical protein